MISPTKAISYFVVETNKYYEENFPLEVIICITCWLIGIGIIHFKKLLFSHGKYIFFYQEFIVLELSQIIVKNYAVNITVLFKIKKALTECDKGEQQPDLVNLEAYLRESAKLKTTIAR